MPKPPFPHMMEGDVPLFASFILTPEGRRFTRWEFDTQVGPGHLTRPEFDPFLAQTAYDQSRLRIDAIGWQDGVPWIFEVKPHAKASAIGQLRLYEHFYRLDRLLVPRLALITDWSPPYVTEYCAVAGIGIFTVKDATFDELVAACHWVGRDCSQLIRIPSL